MVAVPWLFSGLFARQLGLKNQLLKLKETTVLSIKEHIFLPSYSPGFSIWTKIKDAVLTCNRRGVTLPGNLTNAMLRVENRKLYDPAVGISRTEEEK